MLRPSYSELMQTLNTNTDLDNKITSRYAVVVAASKRARQIVDERKLLGLTTSMANNHLEKAVSLAVSEMSDGFIKIIPKIHDEFESVEDKYNNYQNTAYNSYGSVYDNENDNDNDNFDSDEESEIMEKE